MNDKKRMQVYLFKCYDQVMGALPSIGPVRDTLHLRAEVPIKLQNTNKQPLFMMCVHHIIVKKIFKCNTAQKK